MSLLPIVIQSAQPDHSAVVPLLSALDAYLYQQYPVDEFPQDVNHILSLAELQRPTVTFLAAWEGDEAVGCGAMRHVTEKTGAYAEIKRMFVLPQARGQRVGEKLLTALEAHGRTLGLTQVKLETGTRQPEAMRLYARCGYQLCALFGDYAPNPVSVFMEKRL